jgi:hypothetical protein
MEAGGIPTVVIGVSAFRERLRAMNLPRTLITPFPMGRTLGAPGDVETQTSVIKTALNLLETARSAGEMVDFTGKYRL